MNNTLIVFIIILLPYFGMEAQDYKNIKIGGFDLTVPIELSTLSKAEREQKYALQGVIPDEVYQTLNDDVNISFMATLIPIVESQFPILKRNLEKEFTSPNSEILKSEIVVLSGKKFVLTQVILKTNNVFMTNLVTEKEGRMVMLIISHSTIRNDYLNENESILYSLTL